MADEKPPEKHAKFREMFAEAQARKAPLAEERERLTAERDAVMQSPRMNEIRRRLKELNGLLGPIDTELAGLAKIIGPKASLAAEPGVYTKGE